MSEESEEKNRYKSKNNQVFYSTVEENSTLVNTDIVIGNNITSNKVKNNILSFANNC